MSRPAALACLALVAAATPALASPHESCNIPKPGFHFKISVGNGHRDYETQRIFDTMLLRQHGVDPQSVSVASDGCLMVTVPDGNGGYAVQYYDPDTYELKPEIGSSSGSGDGLGINRLFLNVD